MSWSRRQVKLAPVTSVMRCLPALCLPMTFPIRIPILSGSFSRPAATEALTLAPRTCAAMNGGTGDGAMPTKVPENIRPMVMAGLAKLVEEVNKYAAPI